MLLDARLYFMDQCKGVSSEPRIMTCLQLMNEWHQNWWTLSYFNEIKGRQQSVQNKTAQVFYDPTKGTVHYSIKKITEATTCQCSVPLYSTPGSLTVSSDTTIEFRENPSGFTWCMLTNDVRTLSAAVKGHPRSDWDSLKCLQKPYKTNMNADIYNCTHTLRYQLHKHRATAPHSGRVATTFSKDKCKKVKGKFF